MADIQTEKMYVKTKPFIFKKYWVFLLLAASHRCQHAPNKWDFMILLS